MLSNKDACRNPLVCGIIYPVEDSSTATHRPFHFQGFPEDPANEKCMSGTIPTVRTRSLLQTPLWGDFRVFRILNVERFYGL
ncbi:unnamed protein product [Enterobius vermicularis]|uniref:Uncharacterized protein n=1 Tax=Enterobius vermicularis TaxID=51028 RepID=A0A0N4VLA1_ENTVE|nr:unnamed protein product [Enterobius vermicularis]